MGQKSNILTVRNVKSNLNLKKNNPKLFLYGLKFLELFSTLTLKKDVLLTEKTLNFVNNQCFYNLELFYRTKKVVGYKSKKKSESEKRQWIKNSVCAKQIYRKFVFKRVQKFTKQPFRI